MACRARLWTVSEEVDTPLRCSPLLIGALLCSRLSCCLSIFEPTKIGSFCLQNPFTFRVACFSSTTLSLGLLTVSVTGRFTVLGSLSLFQPIVIEVALPRLLRI